MIGKEASTSVFAYPKIDQTKIAVCLQRFLAVDLNFGM